MSLTTDTVRECGGISDVVMGKNSNHHYFKGPSTLPCCFHLVLGTHLSSSLSTNLNYEIIYIQRFLNLNSLLGKRS